MPEFPAAVTPLNHVAVTGREKSHNSVRGKQVRSREVATPVNPLKKRGKKRDPASSVARRGQKVNN